MKVCSVPFDILRFPVLRIVLLCLRLLLVYFCFFFNLLVAGLSFLGIFFFSLGVDRLQHAKRFREYRECTAMGFQLPPRPVPLLPGFLLGSYWAPPFGVWLAVRLSRHISLSRSSRLFYNIFFNPSLPRVVVFSLYGLPWDVVPSDFLVFLGYAIFPPSAVPRLLAPP